MRGQPLIGLEACNVTVRHIYIYIYERESKVSYI